MRHFYLLLLIIIGYSSSSLGQKVYDFESPDNSLSFQYFGSSLEPMLTTIIPNPDKSGTNVSDNVGKYIRATGAQVWAGGFSNPGPVSLIDATNGGSVCIKVWMDHVGVVALKLEQPVGGGEPWVITQPFTTPNTWQELCFDTTIPSLEDSKLPGNGKVFGVVTLFFDFLEPSPTADETYYFDDIKLPGAGGLVTTTIFDFEKAETSGNFSYFGSNLDGMMTEIIANPNATGANTSAKVTKYIKPKVSEVWAGAYSNPDPVTPVDLSNGGKVCVKVHMDHIGSVSLKFEGSTTGQPNWIQTVANTKINEWEELCFDADLPSIEAPFETAKSTYTRVVIFFDFGTAGTGTEVTSYFDDIVTKTGGVPAVRRINFKVNMNNYTGSFDKVYLSGTFNNWSGDGNLLEDPDLDGIWEGFLNLGNGAYEYKVTLDNWDKQEQFTGVEECVKKVDAFVNRLLLVSADADLPEFCYNSCYKCGEEQKITFRLGMGSVVPSPEGIYVAGGGNFDVPGGRFRMQDDNNDKIYELVVPRKKGFTSYYTFVNGACPDYSCKENLEGLPCGNPGNFNDRLLAPIDGDVVIATCFGLCSTNAQCTVGTTDNQIGTGLFELVGNPSVNGSITLNFTDGQNNAKQITMMNGTGQRLSSINVSNVLTHQMDTYQLEAGVYYIMVKSDDKVQTKKFVKI